MWRRGKFKIKTLLCKGKNTQKKYAANRGNHKLNIRSKHSVKANKQWIKKRESEEQTHTHTHTSCTTFKANKTK